MAWNQTGNQVGGWGVGGGRTATQDMWDRKLHPEKYARQNTTPALPDPTAPGSDWSSGGYEDWRASRGYGAGGANTTPGGADATGPYAGEAWDYWKNASATPGMTPEQIATMRSQALTAQTSANKGMTERIREMMAAQGLGNSGMENRMMANQMLGSEANLQNALNQQALAAANAERQDRMGYAQMGLQGAGTLGNLSLGQQGIDYQNAALDAQMRQYYDQADWGKMQDYLSNQYYNQQQQQLKPYQDKLLSMFGNGGVRDPNTRALAPRTW